MDLARNRLECDQRHREKLLLEITTGWRDCNNNVSVIRIMVAGRMLGKSERE